MKPKFHFDFSWPSSIFQIRFGDVVKFYWPSQNISTLIGNSLYYSFLIFLLIFQIVAFSFYGNPNSEQGKARKYFQGIKDNLKEVPIFYPDWTLRLYYDLEDSHPLMKELCDLACNDPNIGKYRLMSIGLSTYYRKVASSNTSRLKAHAGIFKLLMKEIFDPYVLWPFDKKLIS